MATLSWMLLTLYPFVAHSQSGDDGKSFFSQSNTVNRLLGYYKVHNFLDSGESRAGNLSFTCSVRHHNAA